MVEARLSAIDTLRTGGWPATAPALPPRFLRHSDEQTVVGMHAVLAAIARYPEPRPSFDLHGVIAASVQAGRISAAQTLVQAAAIGGTAVSTRIVPECSLHSPAGAVSVGLGMHGPNIGVGGGPDALAEGLFTAIAWLRPMAAGRMRCDGVWLIVSGWDEEPVLDAAGKPITDPICRAVALSLVPLRAGHLALELHVDAAAGLQPPAQTTSGLLTALGNALAAHDHAGDVSQWSHRCPWAAEIRLVPADAATQGEAA
jgi:hypothetical protein